MQQIAAVVGFHWNFTQSNPPDQTRNVVGSELISADGNVGSFGKSQSLLGIGSPEEILESLLGEQSFLRIRLSPHKCVIIRTEWRVGGAGLEGAGSASQADEHDQKERSFQRAEFQLVGLSLTSIAPAKLAERSVTDKLLDP
jgi:hypothetical protein